MSQFDQLLQQAKEETEPQLFLFVFAEATVESTLHSGDHHRGTIQPRMCVDKNPDELTSFADLVAEADSHMKNWNFIIFATLSGENGRMPENKTVDDFFHKITNGIAKGEDLSAYVVWDRDEKPIQIG